MSVYADFIDKYIGDVPHVYFMIRLYILRHEGVSTDIEIARKLRITIKDVEDSRRFWDGLGTVSGPSWDSIGTVSGRSRDKSGKSFEINPELAELCGFAEKLFKKPLTTNEIKTLYSIHDEVKLSLPVMFALLSYASSVDKMSARYIETVAINWKDQGVETVEDAEKLIMEIEKGKKKKKRKTVKKKTANLAERDTDYSFLEEEYFKSIDDGDPGSKSG